ncbi:MAG TPA: hypothetical protein VLB50_10525 [Ignavibacteriaceae bacterium]|nr:hypothetical protein [Ignavibacteriaceae bacterium]
MLKVRMILLSIFLVFLTITSFAGGDVENQLKDYFNKTAQKVRHANSASEKRDILNNSFSGLLKAFNATAEMPLSDKDREGINYFKRIIQQKQYELNGLNGYEKVSDSNLNQFAQFSMQQFEQSAEYITISVIALVLIIILVILLL